MFCKLLLSILIIAIAFNCSVLALTKVPADAFVCPEKYSPPESMCNAIFNPPVPVCQYLRNDEVRQAYNHGCEYMCFEDVKAYKDGKCIDQE